MPKILLVDDDHGIVDLISRYLENEGYEVFTADDGPSGLKAAEVYQPDLIVLDIMLPGFDGLELLSRLRQRSNVYVIMLTAKTEETDRIVGLTVGADDYVPKPFSPRELVARIKAALRRMDTPASLAGQDVFNFPGLRIDTGARRVWVNEKEIDLTPIEFDLLRSLAEYHGLVLSREQILRKVWGYEYFDDLKVVDVHISNLRKKLGPDNGIATVRGVGYRLEAGSK
jgi:two-component system alkaline phosphatase synthesis response regulator PhoP